MYHKDIKVGDGHYIQQWEPANSTARLALSVTAADVGKVARQLDTNVFYLLMDDSPMTWADISSAGNSGTVTSVTSANADATVATTTTTPVITIVQAPALRSATTTVDVSASSAPTAGQVLTATSGTAATWQTPSGGGGGGITLVSPVTFNDTSSSVTFTNIPAGTKRISLMLMDVFSNANTGLLVRIGDSGGLETTGYQSMMVGINTAHTIRDLTNTTGFILGDPAGNTLHGTITLSLGEASTNTWTATSVLNRNNNETTYSSGRKALTGELTQVQFMTISTAPLMSGKLSISYE